MCFLIVFAAVAYAAWHYRTALKSFFTEKGDGE